MADIVSTNCPLSTLTAKVESVTEAVSSTMYNPSSELSVTIVAIVSAFFFFSPVTVMLRGISVVMSSLSYVPSVRIALGATF